MTEAQMVEAMARAMMNVHARRPAQDQSDDREFPVLSLDPDFDDLPRDSSEGTSDDEITQEAVLRLAASALNSIREHINIDKLIQEQEAAIPAGENISLGYALPAEMARVRDEVLPAYYTVGAGGALAIAMMKADLDAAARAMAEGDIGAMIRAYTELKEYKL